MIDFFISDISEDSIQIDLLLSDISEDNILIDFFISDITEDYTSIDLSFHDISEYGTFIDYLISDDYIIYFIDKKQATMKIKRIDFWTLRNNEHFQCQTEFVGLVEKYNPETLKIANIFEQNYLPLYREEDEAILKIRKGTLTEARRKIDRQRSRTFRGMVDMNNAALNHFDPAVVNAAKRLKILFDTCGNIAKLPLMEKTAAITNLVQELNGTFSSDTQTVGIDDRTNKLQQDNDTYEQLVRDDYTEKVAKTTLKAKEVRAKIDVVFRQIIAHIEALSVVEGEENYADFVRRLNIQLEKYADGLAQRGGRHKAKNNH